MSVLLTRDEFRSRVFERDNHKCVFCDSPAQDAHHIIERRLWSDYGYYIENGASVCSQHHIECEQTIISVEDVRHAAGIKKIIVPSHLYTDASYDKWGNITLPNGQRLRGELFYDESVQKILREGNVLHLFTHYVKYPRTHHLPWSPGLTSDDRIHPEMSFFHGKNIIVTTKMDGENTTIYHDYIHARSVTSSGHPSRNWVKSFHAQRQGDVPEGWRICGENLYARHSIAYDALPSYFMGFSMWDDRNVCLSWEDTLEWFELLNIVPVPVLYQGLYNENSIKNIEKQLDFEKDEGYIIRISDSFNYSDFRRAVAKYVRKGHVQTVKHWLHGQPVVPNQLSPNAQTL